VHIPDGFLGVPMSLGMGLIAAGAVSFALRQAALEQPLPSPEDSFEDSFQDSSGNVSALSSPGFSSLAREELSIEAGAPVAGLLAAFVFAAQMLNFPVAAGTSGHLIGAALTAVLIGPSLGIVCMTIVVVLQAFVFADGGLTAVGANLINLAVIPVLASTVLFRLLRRVTGRSPYGVSLAAAITATVSVLLAATAFFIEFSLGGSVSLDTASFAQSLFGIHLLIGLGEGAATAAIIGTIAKTRPDLLGDSLSQDCFLEDSNRTAPPRQMSLEAGLFRGEKSKGRR